MGNTCYHIGSGFLIFLPLFLIFQNGALHIIKALTYTFKFRLALIIDLLFHIPILDPFCSIYQKLHRLKHYPVHPAGKKCR